jgi:hypothetical protein
MSFGRSSTEDNILPLHTATETLVAIQKSSNSRNVLHNSKTISQDPLDLLSSRCLTSRNAARKFNNLNGSPPGASKSFI